MGLPLRFHSGHPVYFLPRHPLIGNIQAAAISAAGALIADRLQQSKRHVLHVHSHGDTVTSVDRASDSQCATTRGVNRRSRRYRMGITRLKGMKIKKR